MYLHKNDMFSKLKGLDLQELIVEIENIYLDYNSRLQLPSNVSFGVEIEYEGFDLDEVMKYLTSQNMIDWRCIYDASLKKSGGEISSPILHDNENDWNHLKIICDYLKKQNVDTCTNAGGHIHIGAHILEQNVKNWRKFLKLYMIYENVLFRFAFGDKISARKGIRSYAPPVAQKLYSEINAINRAKTILELFDSIDISEKYNALSLGHISHFYKKDVYEILGNTLEFRFPNATSEKVIWQNNINSFTKLILACQNEKIDEKYLDYKIKKECNNSQFEWYLYTEICLKKALELVDIIFDNNLEKIYFLRQYLKEFQNNFGLDKAVTAKKFVK